MKTNCLRKMPGSRVIISAVLALSAGVALAQQQQGYGYPPPGYAPPQSPAYSPYQQQPGYGYPQAPAYAPPPQEQGEYVSPLEFLPTFGRRFGQMFRHIFYGDDSPQGGYEGMPGYQGNRPDYNLDTPPSYGSHYGAQPGINVPPAYAPRYETPPAPAPNPQRNLSPAPQPPQQQQVPPPRTYQGSEKKTTPSKKYTPPSITRDAPAQPRREIQQPAPVTSTPPAPAKEKEKVKEKEASTPPTTDYNFYPLPGSKPTAEKEKEAPAPSTAARGNNSGASKGSGNPGSFLKGKRTNKEGRVISPYPPYQELDVTGLSSGSLALDPTTQKVFEVP